MRGGIIRSEPIRRVGITRGEPIRSGLLIPSPEREYWREKTGMITI